VQNEAVEIGQSCLPAVGRQDNHILAYVTCVVTITCLLLWYCAV